MERKKFTLEELKAQYKALGEQIQEQKRAEKAARDAKLKAEKGARYNEVVDAYKKFEELRIAFVDDYGYFTFESKSEGSDLLDWVLRRLI